MIMLLMIMSKGMSPQKSWGSLKVTRLLVYYILFEHSCIEFVGYCEVMWDSGGRGGWGGWDGMGWMLSDSDDTADHPNDPASPHCAQTSNISYSLCLIFCLYISFYFLFFASQDAPKLRYVTE